MNNTNGAFGYTAFDTEVQLSFRHDNGEVALSHVGPNFVILAQATALDACSGDIVITIDGEEQRRRVRINSCDTTARELLVYPDDELPF